MGPKTVEIGSTGQTGPAQIDKSKLDLGDLSREFKLMIVISLIIED